MNFYLWFLLVVIITILILIYVIYKKTPKAQIRTCFIITLLLLLELCSCVFLRRAS